MHLIGIIFAIFIAVNGELILGPTNDEIETGAWIIKIIADIEEMNRIEEAKRIGYAEGFREIVEIPHLKLFHLSDVDPDKHYEEHISIRLSKYKQIEWKRPVKQSTIEQSQIRIFEDEPLPPMFRNLLIGEDEPIMMRGGGGLSPELQNKPDFLCAGPEKEIIKTTKPSYYSDPEYPNQWYFRSCKELKEGRPSYYDARILHAWEHFKVTGKGVKVGVMDEGVYSRHPDLDVDLNLSIDLFNRRNDPSPLDPENSHGTKCAGIIAMKANNNICGVGIAPKATIVGLKISEGKRFDDGFQTRIFAHEVEKIDVVQRAISAHEMNALTKLPEDHAAGLHVGVTKGRRGKGTIYIFSAGNGRDEGKVCSVKAMQCSIYAITIGGVNHDGGVSDYAERCSCVMAVMHSGDALPYTIYTVEINGRGQCSNAFNGTSASSPVASGAMALLLEANPNLKWRDVQHIIAWTSNATPLEKNPVWKTNAAGFKVSLEFGFGLMNVYDMIEMAKNYQGIPPMVTCSIYNKKTMTNLFMSRYSPIQLEIPTTACRGEATEVNHIEHVLLNVTMEYSSRGDLEIVLISPQGTETILLERRPKDMYSTTIEDYDFHSLHTWGEKPSGTWIVKIFDKSGSSGNEGMVERIELIIIGTKDKPPHYRNGNRKYYPRAE